MHLYIWTECRDASFIIPTALNPYQYTFCTTSPACTYNILPLESILLWKRAHYRLSIQPHFRLLRSKTSKSAQATICRATSAPPSHPSYKVMCIAYGPFFMKYFSLFLVFSDLPCIYYVEWCSTISVWIIMSNQHIDHPTITHAHSEGLLVQLVWVREFAGTGNSHGTCTCTVQYMQKFENGIPLCIHVHMHFMCSVDGSEINIPVLLPVCWWDHVHLQDV